MVGNHDILPQKIGVAISRLKSCLEKLIVTYDDEHTYGDEDPLSFGPLTDVERLKEIETKSIFLLGDPESALDDELNLDSEEEEDDGEILVKELGLVDVLPKSLKRLSLPLRWERTEKFCELISRR